MNQKPGEALSTLVFSASLIKQVRKDELEVGDLVLVRTERSLYNIRVVGHGRYCVSGGWFDEKGVSPKEVSIAGCTWGGSVIKTDIVAACGLDLEFGNRVTTSTIQKIIVLPRVSKN